MDGQREELPVNRERVRGFGKGGQEYVYLNCDRKRKQNHPIQKM